MAKRVPFLAVAVLLVLGLGSLRSTSVTSSAEVALGASSAPAGPQEMRGMQMGMQMPEMMKMQDKMMADMKASQGKMDDLVKKMNGATGDAKISAMAELLTELVREHKAMSEGLGGMDRQMMGMMGKMK